MKPGLVTEVEIVRWKDADTPVVRITREFAVRLLDTDREGQFDAPAKNTPEGQAAKAFVEQLKGEKYLLFIPSNHPVKLMDLNSFNRILGELWMDDIKITDILENKGYGKFK
jgi:hypothetical protein